MNERVRPAGKAAIINDYGHILVIRRAKDETHLQDMWDVPGGRFDYGETPREGLRREVREESGLEVDIVEPLKSWSFTKDNGEQIFGTTFLCINENSDIELGEEHSEYRWIVYEDLDSLDMHDELREGVKQAYQRWEKKKELPKLVRNNIPEIIKENDGYLPDVASPKRYPDRDFYREKIVEEAEELLEAETRDEQIEELADLRQALEAYSAREDIDSEHVEQIRKQKKAERGSFSEGKILERNRKSEKN